MPVKKSTPKKTTPAKIKTIKEPPPKNNHTINRLVIPSVSDISNPPTELLAYTTLIYGRKGIGKTSGSASFPGFMNFAYEPRRQNVSLRKLDFELITAEQIHERKEAFDKDEEAFYKKYNNRSYDPWIDVKEFGFLCTQDDTVNGIAVDSVDMAYEMCQESICFNLGVSSPGERSDGGAGWNALKMEFLSFFRTLGDNGLSLLFISHAKARDQEFMDGISKVSIVGPSCSPACLKIMKQMCDFWFYYGYTDGKRTITLRDPTMEVDVATGYGFLDEEGEPINSIEIPEDPTKFYSTLNAAFQGTTTKKKAVPKRKLPTRK